VPSADILCGTALHLPRREAKVFQTGRFTQKN
jgi:hypothetical protein